MNLLSKDRSLGKMLRKEDSFIHVATCEAHLHFINWYNIKHSDSGYYMFKTYFI